MENSRIQFVKWWLKTEFGSKKETQDTIHWDGKKKSDLWESFEQVAHEKTGEPKVMCKRCQTILVHPHHRRAGSSSIFRIPCIAHVIQLSLKQLLGKIKANPVNKEAESEWSDERTQSLQSRRPTRQIVDTLKKVCYLLIP
jgi:hypothetical protein